MRRKKLRGSNTGGRGYGKRARHAGNRGGRGRAGGGKRAQQRLATFRANKHSYNEVNEKRVPLNLNYLGYRIEKLIKSGTVKKDGDRVVINLSELGYSKICGKFGKTKLKLLVYGSASERAKNEIVSAGGEVL